MWRLVCQSRAPLKVSFIWEDSIEQMFYVQIPVGVNGPSITALPYHDTLLGDDVLLHRHKICFTPQSEKLASCMGGILW